MYLCTYIRGGEGDFATFSLGRRYHYIHTMENPLNLHAHRKKGWVSVEEGGRGPLLLWVGEVVGDEKEGRKEGCPSARDSESFW